ncbi:MAG: small subunit ribosomal protein [Patescibacteria group bacterium]|nr:small subunit ribosomal protein [Patescibacteria group bacterium]
MADIDTDIVIDTEAATTEAPVAVEAPTAEEGRRPRRGGDRRGGDRRGRTGDRSRAPRVRSEFDQKMINIRRVARVIAGGRRFSFSVAIIIGNRKGKVGVGLGKAGDTTLAIDKAVRDAKKNLITVNLKKDNSIAHETSAKYCAARVTLMPAPRRGLVAGSSVRPVLELAGITNVVAKVHSGSKNGLNNARAAVEALRSLKA